MTQSRPGEGKKVHPKDKPAQDQFISKNYFVQQLIWAFLGYIYSQGKLGLNPTIRETDQGDQPGCRPHYRKYLEYKLPNDTVCDNYNKFRSHAKGAAEISLKFHKEGTNCGRSVISIVLPTKPFIYFSSGKLPFGSLPASSIIPNYPSFEPRSEAELAAEQQVAENANERTAAPEFNPNEFVNTASGSQSSKLSRSSGSSSSSSFFANRAAEKTNLKVAKSLPKEIYTTSPPKKKTMASDQANAAQQVVFAANERPQDEFSSNGYAKVHALKWSSTGNDWVGYPWYVAGPQPSTLKDNTYRTKNGLQITVPGVSRTHLHHSPDCYELKITSSAMTTSRLQQIICFICLIATVSRASALGNRVFKQSKSSAMNIKITMAGCKWFSW